MSASWRNLLPDAISANRDDQTGEMAYMILV